MINKRLIKTSNINTELLKTENKIKQMKELKQLQ